MPGSKVSDKDRERSPESGVGHRPFLIAPQDQTSLAGAVAFLFCVAAIPTILFFGPRATPDESTLQVTSQIRLRVDLNRASTGELSALPGIGPEMSQRIVEWRAGNGPFATIDGLRQVGGIGPVRLEQLRPFLFVSDVESASVASTTDREALPR
jgi:competence ComEA-like helix-hairpin-helix protein